MSYSVGDIFTLDEEYTERANFCNKNGYYIEEIEQLEDGTRQFQIKEPHTPSLEEIKAQKLTKLSSLSSEFEKTENKEMVVMSSLGFRINADPKAKRNIDTLIELEVTTFRDYDNEIHLDMTIDSLKTIKREISMNAVNLYNQKWVMGEEIKSLKTVEEVDNYCITFEMLNFNSLGENK